jgi:RNA polymerase sigma-70 factor (ECF subfamily)
MTGRDEEQCPMDSPDWLAERFEENRSHLRAVAYRMLGSPNEADDAVQEAWLRLSRADPGAIENLTGWLTTVVARVCLTMLRARRTRREEPAGTDWPEEVAARGDGAADPEQEALLADSLGLALLVVLDTLTPAERVAFVLHDMFDLPYDEVAPIVGRSPDAARQLASRARRRVQGSDVPDVDLSRRRAIVSAFLAASRGGDFGALLALLDPDVVLRADPAAVRLGAAAEVRGAQTLADAFAGRAEAAQPVLVNGVPQAAWAVHGRPRVVFSFTIRDGKITAIDLIADRDQLRQLDIVGLA